jgi:hypothetical protein
MRDQALGLIERDLARWERDAPKLVARRREALEELRAALPGPALGPGSARSQHTSFAVSEVLGEESDNGEHGAPCRAAGHVRSDAVP